MTGMALNQSEIVVAPAAMKSPFAKLLLAALGSAETVLAETTRDVEEQTQRLSGLFTSLTEKSSEQTERLSELFAQITTVDHDGQSFDLVTLPRILQESLQEVTERILVLSKQGVGLIYSLDEILGEIDEVASCIGEIEAINRQTRLLSLNAQIEAGRAGAAGVGFQVVSMEMQSLSRRIDALSEKMRGSVGKVTASIREVIGSIRSEYQELSEIGAMDLTSQIDAKEQLEVLLNALVARNNEIQKELGNSTDASRRMAEEIHDVVMAMQFQDRMKQRTEAVIGAFDQIVSFMGEHDDLAMDQDSCEALTTAILGSITLSDVRREFQRSLSGSEAEEPEDNDDMSNIELF